MLVMGGSAAGAAAEAIADADGAGGEGSADAEGAGEGAEAMADGCEVAFSLGGSDFGVQAKICATSGKTNATGERRYRGGDIGATVSPSRRKCNFALSPKQPTSHKNLARRCIFPLMRRFN